MCIIVIKTVLCLIFMIYIYKVLAHIGIKETDKAAKQAIDIPGFDHNITTPNRLLTTWPLGGLGTPNGKWNREKILASYTTLNHLLENGKFPITALGSTRSNLVGYVFDTLD